MTEEIAPIGATEEVILTPEMVRLMKSEIETVEDLALCTHLTKSKYGTVLERHTLPIRLAPIAYDKSLRGIGLRSGSTYSSRTGFIQNGVEAWVFYPHEDKTMIVKLDIRGITASIGGDCVSKYRILGIDEVIQSIHEPITMRNDSVYIVSATSMKNRECDAGKKLAMLGGRLFFAFGSSTTLGAGLPDDEMMLIDTQSDRIVIANKKDIHPFVEMIYVERHLYGELNGVYSTEVNHDGSHKRLAGDRSPSSGPRWIYAPFIRRDVLDTSKTIGEYIHDDDYIIMSKEDEQTLDLAKRKIQGFRSLFGDSIVLSTSIGDVMSKTEQELLIKYEEEVRLVIESSSYKVEESAKPLAEFVRKSVTGMERKRTVASIDDLSKRLDREFVKLHQFDMAHRNSVKNIEDNAAKIPFRYVGEYDGSMYFLSNNITIASDAGVISFGIVLVKLFYSNNVLCINVFPFYGNKQNVHVLPYIGSDGRVCFGSAADYANKLRVENDIVGLLSLTHKLITQYSVGNAPYSNFESYLTLRSNGFNSLSKSIVDNIIADRTSTVEAEREIITDLNTEQEPW